MDNPYRISDEGKCLVSDIAPGWTLEYYFVDRLLRVRETRNGRSLEQPIAEALLQDPLERSAYFAGIERQPESAVQTEIAMIIPRDEYDDICRALERMGFPITRESWLNLNYPSGLPEEWSQELEQELPPSLQLPVEEG